MASGTTDAALLRLPIPDTRDLRIQPLFTESRCVAMPSDHPLAELESLTMHDLTDEPFIAPRGPKPWRDWWLATDARGDRAPLVGAVVAPRMSGCKPSSPGTD